MYKAEAAAADLVLQKLEPMGGPAWRQTLRDVVGTARGDIASST